MRRLRGFSLVELMVVVMLIAALSAVAIPTFRKYVYRAKRSEAKYALKGIHDTQISWYGNYGAYTDSFSDLGFSLVGGQLIDPSTIDGPTYSFSIQTQDLNGATDGNYRATASGNLDASDAFIDVIIIENQLTVNEPSPHVVNADEMVVLFDDIWKSTVTVSSAP